jgi:hypothetical protein
VPRTKLTQLLVILVVAIATRLIFLEHPIQGDDYYYLASAMYGQTDPAHPGHAQYVFQGKDVDMRGHPHPPLNAWILTLILAIAGDISEVTMHAWYLVFSLMVAISMRALALRYTPHPSWTTLLVLASPAFIVSGNSLESDLPFFACFLTGITAFFYRKLWLAVPMLGAAGLAAYQSVAIVPILWLYLWMKHREWRAGWIVSCTPVIVLVLWQIYERLSGGAFPVAVAAGYFSEYGLQRFLPKVRNAIALSGHLFFVVGPFLTGAVVGTLLMQRRRYDRTNVFLFGWIVIFFVCALALFFAGSARYLLPILPPAAILASRVLQHRKRYLVYGVGLQAALGLGLAFANYEHWKGYQDFIARHQREFSHRRVWVNGEWGLRYYAEALGGLPMRLGQAVQPGDLIISSKLAFPIPYTTGGGSLAPYAEEAIVPQLPFRLVGLDARSAWSTAAMGLLPFDISSSPVDIVRADLVIEKQPTLSFLRMGAPQAESHIVSGIYQLESGLFRWMGEQGSVFLKTNGERAPLEVKLFIPDNAPARVISIEVDGREVDSEKFHRPGLHDLKTVPVQWPRGRALVTIKVDQTFVAPGDTRRLGIILQEVGFRKSIQ